MAYILLLVLLLFNKKRLIIEEMKILIFADSENFKTMFYFKAEVLRFVIIRRENESCCNRFGDNRCRAR